MTDRDDPLTLDRECDVFTRALTGGKATPALSRAYLEGHTTIPLLAAARLRPLSAVDRASLQLARTGPFGTRAADAYARLFRPGGPLRQKLTLVLAILEHAPPHHLLLNTGSGVGRVRAGLGLVGLGTSFLVALSVGIVALAPVHLLTRLTSAPELDG